MKKYKLLWTVTAKRDLEGIIEYIAQDSIEIAVEKYEEIKKAAEKIILFPKQGRIIPELAKQNIVKYREVIIPPWRVMYKIEEDVVYIMAVIDGRRNIEDILLERQLR